MTPEEMLKHVEEEILRFKALYGFHFMDVLVDEITKYNLENCKKSIE